jgi:hypothetical protein
MIETRGRRAKYDFSPLKENQEAEFDFSKSLRVSVINYAKKNGYKIKTRRIADKLKVYREG